MAKPKNPLLSLGARGTIGDALTFQKRNQSTIVREKPIPKDPYSLAQAYQRWDHQDYAYLWTLETEASKQAYRTRASRYHITGFNLWMKEHLRDLPDLAGRWHLDERSGILVQDTSRNNNPGTIFGATPALGIIDNAYHFDGINDRIVIPTAPELHPDSFTIECYLCPHATGISSFPISAYAWVAPQYLGFFFYTDPTDAFWFRVGLGAAGIANAISPAGTLTLNTWIRIIGVYLSGQLKLYINGSLAGSGVGTMVKGDADLWLGGYSGGGQWSHTTLDQVVYYNRALDITEIQRHSERRYPL